MGWLGSTWPPEAGVIFSLQGVRTRLQEDIVCPPPLFFFKTMQIVHYIINSTLFIIKNYKNFLMASLSDGRKLAHDKGGESTPSWEQVVAPSGGG